MRSPLVTARVRRITEQLSLVLLGTLACAIGNAQGKPTAPPAAPVLTFQHDVRPILSNLCYACHGPDDKARKADLRLDTQAGIQRNVVGHKPMQSAIYLRLTAHNAAIMPPATFLKRPTMQQIETIRQWIQQGATWEQHWAYAPLNRPTPPILTGSGAPKSEIDRFILARLKPEGLTLAPAADRRTLLRRLSFDLAGLPPTQEAVEKFVHDTSPNAYEKVVDGLLSSAHYGERMAVYWLDLVRYADTRGYHGDQNQEVSPYRDYVINAFNTNKPFDQFTREQLAGDLLPGAGQEAKIASGYNKLLMTTEEGGSQAKEYLAKYAADRVRNVSAVWLGSTMGCCQCHDHKYDPFSIRDFYSMSAFFADVKQTPVGGLDLTPMPTPGETAKITELNTAISVKQKLLDTQTAELDTAQAAWEMSDGKNLKKPEAVAAILAVALAQRSDKQKADLATYFRTIAPSLASVRAERAKLQADLDAVNNQVRKTMITTTTEPAVVRVLARGNWQDDSGAVVTSAVPAFLDQLNTGGKRATRLDLADWLTSRRNPLTARVMVNRYWSLLFGHGISRGLEDFGAQGAPPTHPELLNWLASEYIDHGWDTKRLLKQIVLSAAYKQTSVPTKELTRLDPANNLFARQGRQRLDAEFIRDNALAASGLLVDRLGGASVKPYQPAHYWDYLNFPMRTWAADKGLDIYRRGLYTYWCRTYLQPSLAAFDAPTREECCSARVVSNTPQQALVLLNDPTYVEAARVLAERILKSPGTTPQARIAAIYRAALQREPTALETQTLTRIYTTHRADYEKDPASAQEILKIGDHPADNSLPPTELAAWTSVTRIVLNLHEFITRN